MQAPTKTTNNMTLREAQRWGQTMLAPLLPATAMQDAELLLCGVLDCTSAHLAAHGDDTLPDAAHAQFAQWITQRMRQEPIQYITGRAFFWGLEFRVTPATLIPRPETELMVERACVLLDSAPASVVDVGTGSGCIAIAIMHARPRTPVIAIDVSDEALAIARENAATNNAATIQFLQNDLLTDAVSFLPEGRLIFTMNLPYLSETRMRGLAPEVAQYEPHTALAAGADGLDAYRTAFAQIASLQRTNMVLLCEIDPEQTQGIISLVQQQFPAASHIVHTDYHGENRLIEITH